MIFWEKHWRNDWKYHKSPNFNESCILMLEMVIITIFQANKQVRSLWNRWDTLNNRTSLLYHYCSLHLLSTLSYFYSKLLRTPWRCSRTFSRTTRYNSQGQPLYFATVNEHHLWAQTMIWAERYFGVVMWPIAFGRKHSERKQPKEKQSDRWNDGAHKCFTLTTNSFCNG